MSKVILADFAIRLADGSVDVAKTCKKFRYALESWINENSSDEARILEAINGVFDKHPAGKRLSMEFIRLRVLAALEVPPEDCNSMGKKVDSVLRDSPEFESKKGRDGGVRRLVFEPAVAETASGEAEVASGEVAAE